MDNSEYEINLVWHKTGGEVKCLLFTRTSRRDAFLQVARDKVAVDDDRDDSDTRHFVATSLKQDQFCLRHRDLKVLQSHKFCAKWI